MFFSHTPLSIEHCLSNNVTPPKGSEGSVLWGYYLYIPKAISTCKRFFDRVIDG